MFVVKRIFRERRFAYTTLPIFFALLTKHSALFESTTQKHLWIGSSKRECTFSTQAPKQRIAGRIKRQVIRSYCDFLHRTHLKNANHSRKNFKSNRFFHHQKDTIGTTARQEQLKDGPYYDQSSYGMKAQKVFNKYEIGLKYPSTPGKQCQRHKLTYAVSQTQNQDTKTRPSRKRVCSISPRNRR